MVNPVPRRKNQSKQTEIQTAARSLPPRDHYRRAIITDARSLPTRDHYRRAIIIAARSLSPRAGYRRSVVDQALERVDLLGTAKACSSNSACSIACAFLDPVEGLADSGRQTTERFQS